MKKMRLTAVVVMLAIVTAVSAQMSLGIKGGVNMSNLVYDDEVNDKNPKIGFNIGLAADVEFAPSVALQTGLFFTTKGYKFDSESLDYTENLMYVQLPLHLAYKIDVMPGTRVVLHADGRGLAHHVQNWLDLHEVGLELRQGTSTTALGTGAPEALTTSTSKSPSPSSVTLMRFVCPAATPPKATPPSPETGSAASTR